MSRMLALLLRVAVWYNYRSNESAWFFVGSLLLANFVVALLLAIFIKCC